MTWSIKTTGYKTRISDCGQFTVSPSCHDRGKWVVFHIGRYVGQFTSMVSAQKNAERVSQTGRIIGGGVPQYVVDQMGRIS